VFAAAIVAADAGLSLVADTLTLPVVIRMRHIDQDKEDKIDPVGGVKEESASPP
jgi:hypothetical protein